jgi:hypothetical protein
MVENELTRAIRELVSEAVKNFALPTKPERGFAEGELRAPKVVNGYLPPKRSGQDEIDNLVRTLIERKVVNSSHSLTSFNSSHSQAFQEYDPFDRQRPSRD